ncbi:BofC C-terminal domain-containing protein [Cohnella sp. 56]|uniref:BofC C-terminal domain-containing protein n=1 Tax=Cohnella sp. 56 TaxID=3113722 RepID=UPI0030E99ADB
MKRLKRQKRHVLSLGVWTAAVLTAAVALAVSKPYLEQADVPADAAAAWADERTTLVSFEDPHSQRGRAIAALAAYDGEIEVVLQRTYVCGEETRKLGTLSSEEAMALLKAHRDWSATLKDAGRLVMFESVDELSAACRASARIGVDKLGYLSLFDGPVRKDKVIRTFFHMDIKALESGVSPQELQQLYEGLPLGDDNDYHQVVSRLSAYASKLDGDIQQP